MKKVAIVVTTIFRLKFLQGYIDNINKYAKEDFEVKIFIIPDLKTPKDAVSQAFNATTSNSNGVFIEYLSLNEQRKFLSRLGEIGTYIHYNTDNRRNVGFLRALDWGCDILISIDDDNYARLDEDFVGNHAQVGKIVELPVVNSSDNWVNICESLVTDTNKSIYPRGFPFYARDVEREVSFKRKKVFLAMNVGLWLHDPDVDSISRLTMLTRTVDFGGREFAIGLHANTPINTQNTGMIRPVAAVYYYIPMGSHIRGLHLDRFGDIFSGYFVKKCIDSMGHYIKIGRPIVDHIRTPHDLFDDLHQELTGIIITEELTKFLASFELSGSSYLGSYENLAIIIGDFCEHTKDLQEDHFKKYFEYVSQAMLVWCKTVKMIGV